ncbi:hypothetical protein ACJX0J_024064 [Zea mays]
MHFSIQLNTVAIYCVYVFNEWVSSKFRGFKDSVSSTDGKYEMTNITTIIAMQMGCKQQAHNQCTATTAISNLAKYELFLKQEKDNAYENTAKVYMIHLPWHVLPYKHYLPKDNYSMSKNLSWSTCTTYIGKVYMTTKGLWPSLHSNLNNMITGVNILQESTEISQQLGTYMTRMCLLIVNIKFIMYLELFGSLLLRVVTFFRVPLEEMGRLVNHAMYLTKMALSNHSTNIFKNHVA